MPLTLQAVLNPTTVAAGQTSTLTVTRSGGGSSSGILYQENFESYSEGAAIALSGWSAAGDNPDFAAIQTYLGSKQINFQIDSDETYTLSRTFAVGGTLEFTWVRADSVSLTVRYRVGSVVTFVLQSFTPRTESFVIPDGATVSLDFSSSGNNAIIGVDDISLFGDVDTSSDAITISLASSAAGVATVPATITIAENQTSATATVTGVAAGETDLTASYDGVDSNVATLTVADPPSYITHNGVVVLVVDPAFERISNVGANVLFTEPSYDRISASQIVVVFNDIRYLLSDLLPLTLQPGERVTLKVLAINNFKGQLPATIEIFSNARNHPSFKFRIDSNGT